MSYVIHKSMSLQYERASKQLADKKSHLPWDPTVAHAQGSRVVLGGERLLVSEVPLHWYVLVKPTVTGVNLN